MIFIKPYNSAVNNQDQNLANNCLRPPLHTCIYMCVYVKYTLFLFNRYYSVCRKWYIFIYECGINKPQHSNSNWIDYINCIHFPTNALQKGMNLSPLSHPLLWLSRTDWVWIKNLQLKLSPVILRILVTEIWYLIFRECYSGCISVYHDNLSELQVLSYM